MNILTSVYKYCFSLRQLLSLDDEFEYFDSVYCCSNSELSIPGNSGSFLHSEIINEVIGTLLARKSGNIITFGHKSLSGRHGQGILNQFEQVFPNTLLNILKNKHFQSLSLQIGENAIKYLLIHTSLFVKIDKGCFYQICGDPIYQFDSSESMNLAKKIRLKRPRLETDECSASKKKLRIHSKTVICWSTILYGKPVYSDRGNIVSSLLPHHVLNCSSLPQLMGKIFQTQKKNYWRVSNCKEYIKELMKRHRNCNYNALLDHYCPLVYQKHPKISPESSNQSNILEYDTKPCQVAGFLKAVIRNVIPVRLFGIKENFERFLDSLSNLVKLKRYDRISLDIFSDSIKISQIDWLNSNRKGKCPPSDYIKKMEVFQEMVYWLVSDFLVPLIKVIILIIQANFYVTESGANRNKLFFFRHKIWTRINAPLYMNMLNTLFVPIDHVLLILSRKSCVMINLDIPLFGCFQNQMGYARLSISARKQ
jgi:hypothetical protein